MDVSLKFENQYEDKRGKILFLKYNNKNINEILGNINILKNDIQNIKEDVRDIKGFMGEH